MHWAVRPCVIHGNDLPRIASSLGFYESRTFPRPWNAKSSRDPFGRIANE